MLARERRKGALRDRTFVHFDVTIFFQGSGELGKRCPML
jgi:hypothetical protein